VAVVLGRRMSPPPPLGAPSPAWDGTNRGGSFTSGGAPSVRGSVMTPVSAEAAATSDEQRYTSSPFTPLRPGKLRLNARRLRVPAAGTWPMPAHEPHVDSDTRAPAASRSASTPSRALVPRI